MERREWVRWLAATAGLQGLDGLAAADVLALGREVHRRAATDGSASRALDPHAERTVTAVAERILPASDTPGATDAGVTAFIDTMLTDWYTPAERARVLRGLRDLDARCRALRGRAFIDCSEPDQVAAVTALDDEVTARRRRGLRDANDHWFAMIKYLTVFGYCTSEVAMRRTLRAYPPPTTYDGCAPVGPA